MKKDIDLHKGKLRVEQAKARIANRYSENNANIACNLLTRLRMNNISHGRIANYAECIIRLLKIKDDKPIDQWTKQDIELIHTAIADSEYENSVKKDTLTALKRLYHYAVHDDIADAAKNKPYDDTVSWITPGSFTDKYNKIQSKDLLTETELLELISAVKEIGGKYVKRNTAIIFLLLEGAYRPSELLLLRISGIEFMENYVRVHTEIGKTGAKSLTLVASFAPIKEWLADHHPHADDPDAFFCYDVNEDGLLEYRRFAGLIAKARIKAKIKKKVWPYLFRHTALTEYSKRLGNIAKIYGNWSQKSNMLARYEHLANSDQEQAALELHGLKPKKETMSILFSKLCPDCKMINSSDKAHCTNCGKELAQKLVAEKQQKIESKKAEEQKHLETKYSDKLETLEKMILEQQQQIKKRDVLIEKILSDGTTVA